MTRKIYRTAQGKMVDIGALQLQNENVRAVGNMSVNARGDMLDANNSPIASRNRLVGKQYNRQTNFASSEKVYASRQIAAELVPEDIPLPPEDFDDNFDKTEIESKLTSVVPQGETGGLAAAIAKARQVKQEPLKTPAELMKSQPGVRKI